MLGRKRHKKIIGSYAAKPLIAPLCPHKERKKLRINNFSIKKPEFIKEREALCHSFDKAKPFCAFKLGPRRISTCRQGTLKCGTRTGKETPCKKMTVDGTTFLNPIKLSEGRSYWNQLFDANNLVPLAVGRTLMPPNRQLHY